MGKSSKHLARSTELHKRYPQVKSAAQPPEFAGPAVGEPWPALNDTDVHWPSAFESRLEYSSETRSDHSIQMLAFHFKANHAVLVFALVLVGLGYAVATNNTKLVSDVLRWSQNGMRHSVSP